jgi:hypothetical protein
VDLKIRALELTTDILSDSCLVAYLYKILEFNKTYLRFVFVCAEGELFLSAVIMVLDMSIGDLSSCPLYMFFPSESINYNFIFLLLFFLLSNGGFEIIFLFPLLTHVLE